jgi:hypothetical protein
VVVVLLMFTSAVQLYVTVLHNYYVQAKELPTGTMPRTAHVCCQTRHPRSLQIRALLSVNR